ncbi:MAG TPA: CBS domain-containing protein [Candidatus Atribacteria bacterium]|jgi:tRNA nucleotidyltransferase (CCA-adding enzyme)|nr:CBS domain-containing protein [Atribacterota bacterium]HOQ50306.1 CBS domain-containing protein [Candidatus Atribacteria bacterium]HPT62767.1 CBS domain-containing protein [Candidatus Atribacteria bacterium]HPZ39152.1 CBS domain-containing protein [Candidatus Atribacteria bacterium]HQD32480.1 CBS domain-containing protein [Candidatus Atribacteria bacterium]
MQIVVSHEGTDFDALASMFAVTKLFPGTKMVIWGTANRNVRHFLSLYGNFFPILKEKEVDWEKVNKIYVVDTTYWERLSKAGELIRDGKVEVVFFDHHSEGENSEGEKKEGVVIIKEYGACTTILVEKIMEQKIALSPLEATLLALGIYEDTGSFTFSTTRAEDLSAASFLLRQGAKVGFVNRFTGIQLTPEQRETLKKMINLLHVEEIEGIPVHFCRMKLTEYVEGISLLVHKLMDLEEIELLFVLMETENKVYVIARSRLEEVDLAKILGKMGGGGHHSAASLTVKGKKIEEVEEMIREALSASLSFTRAKEVMSCPVKVISPSTTIGEALLILMRFGFSGLPIVDENGKLVGMIARRDVEKAFRHGLQNAPVKSFMSSQLVTVDPEDSIFKVRNLMVEKDIGRIPVVRGDTLLGIITRSDLLRVLHQRENSVVQELTRLNLAEKLYLHFSPLDLKLLHFIGDESKRAGAKAYLVGGVVRDIILGFPGYDLDIVVEGDAIELAQTISRKLEGKVVSYPPFGTAILFLKDGRRVDFASARSEYYDSPGAPPHVEYSNLRRDLFRRDFTINAMAISIGTDDWGDLFDFFGGLKDLENKTLRVLHPLSFVEDPARAIRAVRFEQKYGFEIEPFTLSLLKQTVREGLLNKIKPDRLKEEINLILRLPDFYRLLERLYQLDMFPYIFPGSTWRREFEPVYQRLVKLLDRFSFLSLDYFLAKLSPLWGEMDPAYLGELKERLALSKASIRKISTYLDKKEELEEKLPDETLPDSQAYLLLRSLGDEFLLLLEAKWGEDSLPGRRVEQYLKEWRKITPYLTGEDLRRKGIPAGPIYAKILEELKLARIDGLVKSREEEEILVEKIWRNEAHER